MPSSIAALDGFGNPVEWYMIVKLPRMTFSMDSLQNISRDGADASWHLPSSREHCDCPDPDCTDVGPTPNVSAGRGSGLCYLYADSYNATLRFFTEVTNPLKPGSSERLQCLGQGGRDPLSTTMRQLYKARAAPDVEWAFWNDQYEALSDSWNATTCAYSSYSKEALPYKTCSSSAECGKRCKHAASQYRVCTTDSDCATGDACEAIKCEERTLPHYLSGCGGPDAHSKGALAFQKDGTGFHLHATTPNFPDPSLNGSVGITSPRLGCQFEDNVKYSQSFFGVSLSAGVFRHTFRDVLAPALAQARLCSTGTNSCARGDPRAGHLRDWNCTSEHTRGAPWSILDVAFNGSHVRNMSGTSVVTSLHTAGVQAALPPLTAPPSISEVAPSSAPGGSFSSSVELTMIVKAAADTLPPWLLVASKLDANLAVASWLDPSYGAPAICAGDWYAKATDQMCLVDDALNISLQPSGGASHSVENALAASVDIWGIGERAWGLWGNLEQSYASHAKYALSSGGGSDHTEWVVSGDMNQQGFPCSKDCAGSQAGRGGSFIAVKQPTLHASMSRLLKLVCACDVHSQAARRFCNFGCARKDTSAWLRTAPLYRQQVSDWDAIAWQGPGNRTSKTATRMATRHRLASGTSG
jgi:hypothetical protein